MKIQDGHIVGRKPVKAAIGWLKETGQWPENGKIKNGPGPTPLDQRGLPMEEVKDLLALHGAGGFGRQLGVHMRKDAAGCVAGLIKVKRLQLVRYEG